MQAQDGSVAIMTSVQLMRLIDKMMKSTSQYLRELKDTASVNIERKPEPASFFERDDA